MPSTISIPDLAPIRHAFERVDGSRQNPESLFTNLLYAGETVMKLAVAGMLGGVADDRDRHRYRHEYALVRANGIGDWAAELNKLLTGPTAGHLVSVLQDEKRELTEISSEGDWQYEAVKALHDGLTIVHPVVEQLGSRTTGRQWFLKLTEIRNKTRGHGAPTGEQCKIAATALERGIRIFANGFSLFHRPWAHLKQTTSGKYHLTPLGGDKEPFAPLTRKRGIKLPDGVYIWLDGFMRAALLFGEAGSEDILAPNGGFNGKRFEVRSLVTNQIRHVTASEYLIPVTALPSSETEGLHELDIVGELFSNVPPPPDDYIRRPELEESLATKLRDQRRYRIVTLTGRGGVGKTSLALRVLHDVASDGEYEAILWFSARDIDLLAHGPSSVRPKVVTIDDIADEYARLTAIGTDDPERSLRKALRESRFDKPLLFVFDNFETVRSPADLFSWIETYVYPPNKVLITTRTRDFRGDYPVQVRGMREDEARKLAWATATRLGIIDIVTAEYVDEVIGEADGHPYIIKILLGEVAKERRLRNVERVIADQDEVLNALFERTYADLTSLAKRVFLTICSWKSMIPELGLRAVLLRGTTERIDAREAIEELERVSFIETTASSDGEIFVHAPLAATLFGRQKLIASPYRSAVEADRALLFEFGASQRSDVQRGLTPKVEQFIRNIERRLDDDDTEWDELLPILQFIARHHPPTWMTLANFHERRGDLQVAKEDVRRFLETALSIEDRLKGWRRLAELAGRDEDPMEEIQARVEIVCTPGIPIQELSDAAGRIGKILNDHRGEIDKDEKEMMIRRAADAFQYRLGEATATDCSRLAWLYLYLGETERAAGIVETGLERDPTNRHCTGLAERLSIKAG